jgi:probable LLM family oxidoreductase
MEFGLYTFADINPEQADSKSTHRRMQELMEEIRLADQLGYHVFGIGEHHRKDYTVSSPAVVLGAAAAVTKNIRLTSAVTVLSSDDPVRVFQQFATVDQISGGRAEIMAGRGSFIESYPLFGYDLRDYDELFNEKLELLMALLKQEKINWKGKHRSALTNLHVYPKSYQQPIPLWLAVGGTPESAIRAGKLGLPMALAIIGGRPSQFVPFVNLYRETATASGFNPDSLGFSINSHVYVAETSSQAAEEYFTHYTEMMNRIGRERGWSPMTRAQFEAARSPQGAILVGSPDEVAEKIIHEHSLFGNTRFLAQMSLGTVPHSLILKSMELFAEKVIPKVQQAISLTTTK